MRRNKVTLIPVCSEAPTSRRRAASIKKAEVPVDFSSLDSSASQDDSFQPLQSKPPLCKAGKRALTSEPPADLGCAVRDPPLFDDCQTRGAPCQPDAMLSVFRSIPTQMDYKGQKLAEQIFQGIILFSAVIGFVYGYVTEQFGWTVYIVMAGFAISCLLTLPPWPIYRRNPLKWLPVQESITDDKKPADRKVKRHPKN